MKKIYMFLILTLLAVVPMAAQERGKLSPEKRKEFREYKMKFLAQEMGLKEETSKKFFEVYNQLSDERFEIRREIHELDRKIKEGTATDQDYARLNKLKDQEAEIEKKYDGKFAAFLTNKDIFKMKEAEGVFRKKLHEMKAKKEKKQK